MDGDAYIQTLARWIQREGKRLAERNPDPPVAISLHHLYYLLTRIDDLEVPIGPLNIRLEDISNEHETSASSSSSNYVSFSKRNSDAASIRSVSSIRSVMSTVSTSMWTGFGMFGQASRTEEQIADDLKQLYSAFCKIPTIRVCPNKSIRLVSGFEGYPFDTAVPLLAFKNLQVLELVSYSPKQFYGWDELSEQLRTLKVRNCALENVAILTIDVIKEELERKRRKAERGTRHWQAVSDGASPFPSSPKPGIQTSYFQQQKHGRSGSVDGSLAVSPSTYSARPGTTRKTSRTDRHGSNLPFTSDLPPPAFVLPSSKWQFLRFLSLANNSLTTISAEALAPLAATLNFLDLSKNRFVVIPAALSTLSALRSLDLAGNRIESLHSLLQSPIPGISTLNLRANRLVTIAGIDRLPSLERVDLRDNYLKDPVEMARLNVAPNLSELWVAGNPFTRTHYNYYRISIFNVFRANAGMSEDITLDGKKPGILEKRSLEARAIEAHPAPKLAPTTFHGTQHPLTPTKQDSGSIKTNGTSTDELSVKPKRKVHKSRVIDLSVSAKDTTSRHGATEQQAGTNTMTDTRPLLPESGDSSIGDEYRRKVEALRQEVGSGWIRVIEEETFRNKGNQVEQL